jgi:hypothetical protein
VGGAIELLKFQPDLISNLMLDNDYNFIGIVCYACAGWRHWSEDYVVGNLLYDIGVRKSNLSGLRSRKGNSVTFYLSSVVSRQ